MGPCLFRRVFSTRRWPPDVQGPFGDQSRRKNSTRTRQMTRSSGFFVQIGSQRVPGHPEAKSDQILIGSGLLEAILEASRPASKPTSQAQPFGRVFSTKRTRGQDRRVFSPRSRENSTILSSDTFRRKNSTKRLSLACWLACWPAGLQNGLQEAISN